MHDKELFGKLCPPGNRSRKGWYKFEGLEEETPGVTTTLKVLNKFALIPWAAWCEREYMAKIAADVHENFRHSDREAFLISLGMKCGKGYGYQAEVSRTQKIGSSFHSEVESFLQNSDGGETPKPSNDLFRKWESWWNGFCGTRLQKWSSERTLLDNRHNYAGTADLLALDNWENPWILDWKTSSEVRVEHALQVGAYGLAFESTVGCFPRALVVCVPREEGEEIKTKEFSPTETQALAKSFLAIKAAWEAERDAMGILKPKKKK
jgi:hypothetical protein